MINVLIADDNVYYATSLMNILNKSNNNIKVCFITKNGKEAIDIINNYSNIDVIILDLKMPIYDGKQVLEMIRNKNKYRKSCIIISGDITLINQISKNEIVYSVINKTMDIKEIINKVNELMKYKEEMLMKENLKNQIIKELLYLGFNISYKGTRYLISAIEYIVISQNKEIKKLEKDVYQKLANKYGETVHNIKSNINRSITAMYYECEIEKLKRYFYFSKDVKPNVKTIIETVINKIYFID